MKIFISGPVSGTTDYMERFGNAQKYLESLGHSVINPVLVTSNLPKDTTQKEYLSLDLTMLCMCDAIYMLNGYENSKGALAELHTAKSVGCEIFYEDRTGVVPPVVVSTLGWIPFSEQKPKQNECVNGAPKCYLILDVCGEMYVARYTNNGWVPTNSRLALVSDDVVEAWMNIPDPSVRIHRRVKYV